MFARAKPALEPPLCGVGEVLVEDGGEGIERAERVYVGPPADGDVVRSVAGPGARVDRYAHVGSSSRAATGAALLQAHSVAQSALDDEALEVAQDSRRVEPSGVAAGFRREADRAGLPRTYRDDEPPASFAHEIILVASARARKAAGQAGGGYDRR
jgi:hypothetical protein